MRKYKLDLFMFTENLWLNPKTGEYEGLDPETIIDYGVVDEGIFSSLDALKDHLQQYMDNYDVQAFEGFLEWDCEGEHCINTPLKEQVPFFERYKAFIWEIDATPLHEDDLELFAKDFSKEKNND